MRERFLAGIESSVKSPHSYFLGLLTSLIITLLLIILNAFLSNNFMQTSIALSLKLQTISMQWFGLIFSYIIPIFIVIVLTLVYLIRRNLEEKFFMIFFVCLFFYLQGILKLFFAEQRPIFLCFGVSESNCVCDYGMPSGHSLFISSILLFTFDELTKNFRLNLLTKTTIALIFAITAISVGLSRIYYLAHSYSQVLLGFSFGASYFFLMMVLRNRIKKHLLQPILFKDRFVSRRGIFYLAIFAISANGLLTLLWAYRFWILERDPLFLVNFKNCLSCLVNIQVNFATKIFAEGLFFNLIFGMLIGVFAWKGPLYEFEGLYFDRKIGSFLLRLLVFSLFASPILLAKFPKSNIILIQILRVPIFALLGGYLLTHPFVLVLVKMSDKQDLIFREDLEGDLKEKFSMSDNRIENKELELVDKT